MAKLYDVVVTMLQVALNDAKAKLKDARAANAPAATIKAAENDVRKAQADLDKYQKSDGPERSRLNDKYMQKFYDTYGAWVQDLVEQFPELTNLFAKAVKNNWNLDEFTSNLYSSDWWANQAAMGRGNTWLTAFKMEHDPANKGMWADMLDTARKAIVAAAKDAGIVLDEKNQLPNLLRMYWYQGWNNDPAEMVHYLQKRATNPNQTLITNPDGTVQTPPNMQSTVNELRSLAEDYGISLPKDVLDQWAKKILDPTINTNKSENANFLQYLVNESRSRYAGLADRIDEKTTLRQLTGGYLSTLARMLELDPTTLKLDDASMDPLLKRALTGFNPDSGKPEAMPLWKFEQEIKKDPRWQYTANALDVYSNIGSNLSRMMGFVGQL